MIAIPCILYVEEDLAAAMVRVKEMDKMEFRKGAPFIMPDLDRALYEVGSYRTPAGEKSYRVKVTLVYTDLAEADPDTRAGEYEFVLIRAKNSLEARERALDLFHEAHPIGNLDAVDISTIVEPMQEKNHVA